MQAMGDPCIDQGIGPETPRSSSKFSEDSLWLEAILSPADSPRTEELDLLSTTGHGGKPRSMTDDRYQLALALKSRSSQRQGRLQTQQDSELSSGLPAGSAGRASPEPSPSVDETGGQQSDAPSQSETARADCSHASERPREASTGE